MNSFLALFPHAWLTRLTSFSVIALIMIGVTNTPRVMASESPASNNIKQVLIFGVVPQQSTAQLAKLWPPILAGLSQGANYELQFATAPDIPTFEARLKAGVYDVAYLNPYHYIVFHEFPGYQALAREKNKKLKGIVVVRKDSPIKSIEQLEGKTLAFPAPASFAASVLPRAYLKNAKINVDVKYVGSHDSVYLSVIQGLVDAGGGVQRTFNNLTDTQKQQLNILWKTPEYTPHAIATHPRVSEVHRQALLEQFLKLSTTPAGQVLLSSVDFSAFTAGEDKDWDDIRSLSLGSLSKPLGEK
ncbi:phosphate ABC transporter substrate-binding protein [Shewanella baltica]|uniref:phosphate/phosphite/phosphonate ABC transporter substrate-binding protein n=1 Tax=Shewanella baltica TaxID=62322 RepID=UPI0007B4E060|nr:phosphate/phosphite/phosphonate ABC transporter substrate-binding protein [Shewanella baltica]KZK70147.1 phosphate ABC transporter substrate-binding protein [Shewanella baltica]